MLQRNLEIIRQRWPDLETLLLQAPPCPALIEKETPEETLVIDGIHLSSCYNRAAEAHIQASTIPFNSSSAWLYGIGCGDLPSLLLKRKSLQRLNVVILNPAVARVAFSHFDQSTWLTDPRVELLSGEEKNLGTPLTAIPPCLQLADDHAARLRDLVALELETPYLRAKHSAENPSVMRRINRNARFIETDGDVRQLFASKPSATIIVAAAGPSLGKNVAWLAANRTNYSIISVNSALKPLALAGIIPDVAITIDDDPKILSCFEGYDLSDFKAVPMVYFPRVPEQVLEVWPGQRLTAYANHPSYHEICARYPRGKLFSSGTVLHPAVDLAVQMGAAQVVLFGADLAFPGGQKYTSGAGWEENEAFLKRHWVLDGHGNRVDTFASFRGYLRDLESYIAGHPQVRFFNCSKDGALIKGASFWKETI